ncbi:hypothetical protein PRIPAC_90424 [Pristionchus pacificus]|uniref:Uncharacterized protein n=1 Tax=Pristionchus pacificus TaxID=54126 RepID=A0A2A6B5S6_PRIPA|nr:hypothetical protein PRIPAC_90424 [Pristionchus pacificus]|eukprot:PDM61227.1 hypothetical protein PRIPAC_50669 [Pristionchus pacificus]
MHILFVISMLIVLATPTYGHNLPDRFFGKFSLDHSDNWDEYLAAKGWNWVLRRIISLLHVDIVFTKVDEHSFNYEVQTLVKDLRVHNNVLGRESEMEMLDGSFSKKMVKVTFTYQNATLYLHQVPIEHDPFLVDTFTFKVDGDILKATAEAEGVASTRYYSRVV